MQVMTIGQTATQIVGIIGKRALVIDKSNHSNLRIYLAKHFNIGFDATLCIEPKRAEVIERHMRVAQYNKSLLATDHEIKAIGQKMLSRFCAAGHAH